MGTTLTGTTPQDTYDSLIKVTDNGPLSGSLKVLTDGLGNNSTLSLSTAAASIAGTLAVTGAATLSSSITASGIASLGIGQTTDLAYIGDRTTVNTRYIKFERASALTDIVNIQGVNGGVGFADIALQVGGGNVGIGTSAPAATLHLDASGGATIRLQRTSASANRFDVGTDGTNLEFNVRDTGNFTFGGTGSYVRLASATGGIQFNGDTAAANALDDYEEGTWTMGVSFGGASVGVTVDSTTGTYTKIGRQVTVNGLIQLTNKGSSTGVARVTGLPFTIANSTGNYSAASLRLSNINFTNQFQGFGVINQTTISLEETTTLGVVTDLTNADFANNSAVIVGLTYFV